MSDVGGIAADRLRSFIERWERLQEEIEALKTDQKEVMAEAKGTGFDVKTIRQIIKLRKLTPAERDEQEALLDIYKAALGMLDGTPLGDAAIRRLTNTDPLPEPKRPARPVSGKKPDGQTDLEEFTDRTAVPEEASPPPGPTTEEAEAMGREAAKAGAPVTKNPFPPHDPCRAAWDQGWCMESGSDGMDLPPAWQRPKKPGKGAGKNDSKKAA